MLAVIRVLTTTDEQLLSAHGRIISEKFKIPTRSYCIGGQSKGIYDDESERMAIPKIAELAAEVVSEAQALFISCAADPGLEEVRSQVKVPVIGAGSAAAVVGLALDREGIAARLGETARLEASILHPQTWAGRSALFWPGTRCTSRFGLIKPWATKPLSSSTRTGLRTIRTERRSCPICPDLVQSVDSDVGE